MKKSKKTAGQKAQPRDDGREPTEAQKRALRASYLELGALENITVEDVHPGVLALAREMGVSPKAAKKIAFHERWELQRRAGHARAWQENHALGAKDEADFIVRDVSRRYSHLLLEGEVGMRFAITIARETWRRIMAPVLVWEARQEHEEARAAYDEAKAKRLAAQPPQP